MTDAPAIPDSSHIVAQRKERMCGKKASFTTRAAAERRAEKFGQRVYECPVCFCWHCTSRETWRDDFVTVEEMAKAVATAQSVERAGIKAERAFLNNQNQQLRGNHKAEKAALNIRIAELLKENADLRKRVRELARP